MSGGLDRIGARLTTTIGTLDDTLRAQIRRLDVRIDAVDRDSGRSPHP
jgi:hypothetical protein